MLFKSFFFLFQGPFPSPGFQSFLRLSSSYFELCSVDVHGQQFRLFSLVTSLVVSKLYFCKQINFQTKPQNRPSTPLYTNTSPKGRKLAFSHENKTSRKRVKIGRWQAGYKLKERHNFNTGGRRTRPAAECSSRWQKMKTTRYTLKSHDVY